ncbi:MAG: hypothetical protein K2G44_04035 [Clostridia bacterium]|nr:hypothetical protein [Clostridia bacterium]
MSSKEKTPMSEEKRKRIVAAMTAAGVFLIIFLAIILAIQFVQIGVKTSQKKKLERLRDEYVEQSQEAERDLEYFKSLEGLEYLALINGWTKQSK